MGSEMCIRDRNSLLYFVTLAIVIAEIATLFTMFVPRLNHFARGTLMGFFWLVHLGSLLTMSIGFFSATAMVAWLVFIPSEVWNSLSGQPVGFKVNKSLRSNDRSLERISQLVCAVFLVYITVQNVVYALGPELSSKFGALERIGSTTMTIQKFHLFSQPTVFSPWFEYSATLTDGQQADLFNDRHKDVGDKPESVYTYMQNQSWRAMHWNMISHPLYPPSDELVYHAIRTRLLTKMIQVWNSEHFDNQVDSAQLKCHLDPIELRRINPEDRNVFVNQEERELEWATYESRSFRSR